LVNCLGYSIDILVKEPKVLGLLGHRLVKQPKTLIKLGDRRIQSFKKEMVSIEKRPYPD